MKEQLLAASHLHYGRAVGGETQAQSQLRTPPPRLKRWAQRENRGWCSYSSQAPYLPQISREKSPKLSRPPRVPATLASPSLHSDLFKIIQGPPKWGRGIGRNGAGGGGHRRGPEKQQDPRGRAAAGLQGRTWRGEAQTLSLLEMLAAFLRFPTLPSDPHVTPGSPRH